MHTLRRATGSVLLLAALVLLWMTAAPATMGGPLSVVTIQGSSMEPTLFSGDLVLLRRAADYQVGEAVAFRSDMAGAVVLHRIVAEEASTGRYVLIGDNNDFLDRYRPLPEEVVGRMVLRIPADVAAALRDSVPWVAGLGAALLVMFLRETLLPRPRRRPLRSSRGSSGGTRRVVRMAMATTTE